MATAKAREAMRRRGAFLVALVTACAPSPASQEGGNPEELRGRTFTSVAIERDGDEVPLVGDTRVTLAFEGQSLSWRAGCNDISAPAEITADTLRVGDVVTTDLGCDPDLQRQDEWLTAFLTSQPQWELDSGRLTLTGDRIRMILVEQ